MVREVNLLRRTEFSAYPYCLAVLEGYAELVPLWQRSCLFLYAGFGTWLANRFGVDMAAMWSRSESILEEACVVNNLEPVQLAEMLRQFSTLRMREQGPLEYQEAKETVYEQLYWPLGAYAWFALQPSAFARQSFVMNIADSIEQESAQVADLGCGPGAILSNLPVYRPSWWAQGLDISHAATDNGTRLADHKGVGERVRFSIGDLVNLPYRVASFDLVVASEVLEHVPAIFGADVGQRHLAGARERPCREVFHAVQQARIEDFLVQPSEFGAIFIPRAHRLWWELFAARRGLR